VALISLSLSLSLFLQLYHFPAGSCNLVHAGGLVQSFFFLSFFFSLLLRGLGLGVPGGNAATATATAALGDDEG
jgi:hypothetical protein